MFRFKYVLQYFLCFIFYLLFIILWYPDCIKYSNIRKELNILTQNCTIEIIADSNYKYNYLNTVYIYDGLYTPEELNKIDFEIFINEMNDSEVYSKSSLQYYNKKYSDMIIVFLAVTIIFIVTIIGIKFNR